MRETFLLNTAMEAHLPEEEHHRSGSAYQTIAGVVSACVGVFLTVMLSLCATYQVKLSFQSFVPVPVSTFLPPESIATDVQCVVMQVEL